MNLVAYPFEFISFRLKKLEIPYGLAYCNQYNDIKINNHILD